MKHPDFDKAFAPTPEIVSLSIEAAFRKGEKAMKFRHKLTAALSAAAVIAVACAAAVFALPNEPRPDVVSQPVLKNPTEKTYTSSVSYDAEGNIVHLESEPLPTAAATQEPTENRETTAAATAEPTPPPIPQEEQIVYHTEQGKYYHTNMHCSGMMNAKAHPITEAANAGKLPCPVCIQEITAYTTVDSSLPDAETPFYDADAVPVEAEISPAKKASDVFTNVFGAYLFDVFEDYEYISAQASGLASNDGLLTETIEFCFAKDGWQFVPVTVTIESRNDKILSGNIVFTYPENFDHEAFFSGCSVWYYNAYCQAMETFVSMPVNSHINMPTDALTRVYAYFDSELKPSVCMFDFETENGFYSMSFDVNGNDVSLASMNYNVSKA